MTLAQRITQAAEIAHGQGTPYDDKPERMALRNFLKNCPNFQAFWANYFVTPPNTKIKDDPLGECKVDLGIVDDIYGTTIYGLIEVDVFNSWAESYPSHYKYFHVLERKLKYFEDTDHRYLTCTFNKWHNQMCCTTKENIERCHFLYGVQEIYMPKIDAYDRVIRCPLDENIHWFEIQ